MMVNHEPTQESASERVNQVRCDTNFVFHQTFTDVETLTSSTKEWDLEFMQLKRGQFNGHIFQAVAPGWQLSHAGFGCALKQEGLPPSHLRNIAIPATPFQNFRWREHQVCANNMMIFPLGGELDSISSNDFEVFILAVEEERLIQLCRVLEIDDVEILGKNKEVISCEENAIQNLRRTLSGFIQQIMSSPKDIRQAYFAKHLVDDICTETLSALDCGQAVKRLVVPRRQNYVLMTAESYIREKAHEGVSIYEVCHHLNISERTLRAAFQNRYGVSPKTYLKCYRLTQVRRQLIQSSGTKTKVIDIANAWGFWHAGQFSSDYKAMFGELPAETLISR